MSVKSVAAFDSAIIGVGVGLCAAIFVADLYVPLGVAGGVPYVAPVLVAMWASGRRAILWMAVLGAALTVLGYAYSPAGGTPWMVMANRALALFAIVAVAVIAYRRKRDSDLALSQSHNLLEAVVAGASDAVFVKDRHGRILSANAEYARIAGVSSAEEAVGKTDEELLPPEILGRVRDSERSIIETGEDATLELDLLVDGVRRSFLMLKSPYRDADGRIVGVLGIGRDITARKPVEQALKRSNELLSAIATAQSEFIAERDSDAVFERLLGVLLSVTESEYGFIGEVMYTDNDVPFLKTRAITDIAWDDATRAFYEANAPAGLQFHNLDTLFGHALKTGEVVIANDPGTDPRSGGLPQGHPPLDAFLAVPLRKGDNMIGLLGIANRPGGYDAELVNLLHPLVSTAANIVDMWRSNERRKAVEKALRESEAQFRAVFEEAVLGITLIAADGSIQDANPAALGMFGLTGDEIRGATIESLTVPEDVAFSLKYFRDQVAGKFDTLQFEKRYLRKDGEAFTARVVAFVVRDDEGNHKFIVAMIDDITERKKAEDALRESEERFRSLVELLPEAVHVNRDNRIVFANSKAVELYGAGSVDRLLGMETDEFVHPGDRALVRVRRAQVMEIGGALPLAEIRQRRLDGSFFEGESHITRVNWDGQPAALVFVRDITERKRAEERLRRSQRLEAVGQLTGGVAHDFNNLLAIILGNAELLNERLGDDAMAETVIRAANRGGELTRRLLAFSRQQALQPEIVDLNAIVAGMTEVLRRTLGERIEIASEAVVGVWPVEVDPGQFENALLNLSINARDAMSGGGRLVIATANVTLDDGNGADGEPAPGDYVALSVTDTGTGMSQEVSSRVFEPFFTTKEAGEGSGLGLSMVHGFVKQSGGYVTIDSEPERGTTMTLLLPRASPAGPQMDQELSFEKREPRASGETVLVVEDDEAVRALAADMLENLGYRVLVAGDGAAAETALANGGAIDLLLSDIVLPGEMSGPQIAERARRLHPDIGVLFMSGYPDHAMGGNGLPAGAPEFLTKPFRKRDLAHRVRTAIGGAPD